MNTVLQLTFRGFINFFIEDKSSCSVGSGYFGVDSFLSLFNEANDLFSLETGISARGEQEYTKMGYTRFAYITWFW